LIQGNLTGYAGCSHPLPPSGQHLTGEMGREY
jgi:hypothetical protein